MTLPSRRAADSVGNIPLRVLKPRRAAPSDAVRPTRAEINLQALRHNLRVVQRHAGQAKIWAVLKADGYGHGAPAVARTLERAGVQGFCVALLEEGVELREAGITTPILVMGGYYAQAHEEMLARKLTPVVYDEGQLEGFARAVRTAELDVPVDVHVKVDTGMARLGITMRSLDAFASALGNFPEIRVTGLMTHLASADAITLSSTHEQLARFEEASKLLAARGIRPGLRHAANSAAVLRGAGTFDVVRPGIAIFGVSPLATPGEGDLRPVMRVRSEIVALRDIDAGSPVGYGGTWIAPRASRIATMPMGYADGLSRHLSGKGHALVRGKRAPFVGAISMDMAMIDVTDIPGACVRDEVVVLGTQEGALGKDTITADEIARHSGTISWEVLTSVSRRVPRFYREP